MQTRLCDAAGAAADGVPDFLECAAYDLADPALPAQLVDGVVDDCLTGGVGRLWERGWQPLDVAEFASRRLSAPARQLVLDVTAHQAARYSRATLDPRWRSQLEELGTSPHWATDGAHLTRWASRRRLDRVETIGLALAALTFLYAAPRLAQVLPPPGRSGAAGRVGAAGAGERLRRDEAGEKVLHRIRALLAKAESTEFPEEAEALSSKAQALMTKFSLDQAMLAANSAKSSAGACRAAGAHASVRRVWLRAPYLNAKALLASVVAKANRAQAVSDTHTGHVTIVGAEADLSLVELLVTSLLLQADRAMLAASPSAGAGGHSRTRSWRQSFLVSYATRIGQRLTEASEASMAEYDAGHPGTSARLLPALTAREHAVQKLVAELFPRIRKSAVSTSNPAGWEAGKRAADLADLGARRGVGRAAS
ncbi:DUF2786 domain-containing protein [Actinopolymorpha sp. NPDC004070]|uniref:DUF2786 domain-containing protein n=1 Tax=Actinopolymorpha sp. NPDC004070 TaxID=3154548 RepID=UPI0033A453AF